MKNSNITKVTPKMDITFEIEPTTEFKNNLDSIKVELLNHTDIRDLNKFAPDFANATWNIESHDSSKSGDRNGAEYVKGAVDGIVLPTLLETIGLTFLIDGIDMTTVTHILRYRTASFSADCSADKLWQNKPALVPTSVQQSKEIYEKYKIVTEMAKQVYCDIINSGEISIMDARGILPRNLSTFYFMHISLKDAIHFITQRIDKQIQPEVDNIIAYKMYIEILKVYPFLRGTINMKRPAYHFIKQAGSTGATNLYWPDEDSDIFDWNPDSFIYKCTRNQLNGTDKNASNHFDQLRLNLWNEITELETVKPKIVEQINMELFSHED